MIDYKGDLCAHLDDVWNEAQSKRLQMSERLRAAKFICLFGAGEVGRAVADDLEDAGVKVDAFCDNNNELWGRVGYRGIPCLSVGDLACRKDDALVLVTTGHHRAVCSQLESGGFRNFMVVRQRQIRNNGYFNGLSCGFVKSAIGDLIDMMEDDRSKAVVDVVVRHWFGASDAGRTFGSVSTPDQYFPADIVNVSSREVFIDAGAYTGDTVTSFLAHCAGRFSRIIAYELDRNYYLKLQSYVGALEPEVRKKTETYNMGLYDENKTVEYAANSTSTSVSSSAGAPGEVVRLSDHIHGTHVSFIKMDIEGAEARALRGAEDIIVENLPKLAICVYHAPSHLWEVPFFIRKIAPEYRLYFRHHSDLEFETVCYAVP